MKKTIFRKILFYLSVPKCVACGERLDIDDDALCKRCVPEYEEIKKRNCSRCAKLLCECPCSNEFLENHYVKRLIKVFRYVRHRDDTVANNLIFSLKRDNREDVLKFLSGELVVAVKNSISDTDSYIITNVPRRKRAIIKFGIDHAELLARELSRRLGCEFRPLLKSKSKRAQKTTHGQERIKNAEFDIADINLKGKRIILVDDIVTTGASLGSCAALLRSVGAKEIVGASLAVAYKDKYTPFLYTPPIN